MAYSMILMNPTYIDNDTKMGIGVSKVGILLLVMFKWTVTAMIC
jgi:hypothetical protein